MVASFSQLLQRRYKDQIDEDANDYIEFIVEGANRMKDLIDDLLAFSRLNTEAKEFKLTDINNVLDDVLVNLNPSIVENNAQITHGPLPIIKVDSSQIRQLLQNLISNAIKFHGDKPPKIHISAKESGKEWLFSVSDNGIGIDTEHLEKIFNVFNRLHTREEYEGTGIGLAICKRIINRHEGRIWVESEEGKGSTFYFTIPKSEMDINPK
jgi:light-regulated signal transduction histidine kinase (bacteriophytochrome)